MPRHLHRSISIASDDELGWLSAAIGPDPVWVVGGWVRDRLLGRDSHDLDLVLAAGAATLDDIARRIRDRLDGRLLYLGAPRHRIARIVAKQSQVEIWALDGRSLSADLLRRDFTVNALAWRLPAGPLVDRVGGRADIETRTLRAVSIENILADPIRVLRGPRLVAEIAGLEPDPATLRCLQRASPFVRSCPRERSGHELLRIFKAPFPHRGLQLIGFLGLIHALAPEPPACDSVWCERLPEIAGRLQRDDASVDEESRCVVLLASLLRAWGRPPERALHPFAWPRAVLEVASAIAAEIDRVLRAKATADQREIIHALGSATPMAMLLAHSVEPEFSWSHWHGLWERHGEELQRLRPALGAIEISTLLGIEPGPALGSAIRALVRAQARGEVSSREDALEFLSHHSS